MNHKMPSVKVVDEMSKAMDHYPRPGAIRHRQTLKRILLIQPPAFCNNQRGDMMPHPPLGIAYIGAMLERCGYEVKILDCLIEGWTTETRVGPEKLLVGLSFDEIRAFIRTYDPDVVGVTSMFTSQRKNAHRVAAIVKEIDAEMLVVFGGAHPTSVPESVLEDPCVDVAVLGEGDNVIVPLLECIESNRDLRSLDGLAYRDESGSMVVIEKKTQVADLDSLPFPARHLLPMEKYFAARIHHGGVGRGNRPTPMITSRGCQYRCNFCTAFKVFTRRPRMRSIESVLAEIDELVTKYGVDEIFFEDDQLIAKQRRSGELFDAMAARYQLLWDTPNGVSPWLLDDEILGKMKAAGCYRVNLAIESGNQWVLDNIINKPVKLDTIPGLVKLVRKHGMEVNTYVVVGNIGRAAVETLDQIKETFAFCRKLRIYPHSSLLTAYPGSEVLEVAKEKGYLVPEFEWDDLVIDKFQLQTPLWTPEQLMDVVASERIKTRWWVAVSYPIPTLRKAIGLFMHTPLGTVASIGRFLRASLFRIFVKRFGF